MFSGHKAVLSGPAGGYVGYARTTHLLPPSPSPTTLEQQQDHHQIHHPDLDLTTKVPPTTPHPDPHPHPDPPLIGFDMGGTSTDVSRFAGTFEQVFESLTAGVVIQAPQLDINTVAAGGGSLLRFEGGLYCVGPESAGAHPGPVCYRKTGGKLAITDANLVLGRIIPHHFPHVFGDTEDMPLDVEATRAAFAALARTIIPSGPGVSLAGGEEGDLSGVVDQVIDRSLSMMTHLTI